jgi:hypothetical protein
LEAGHPHRARAPPAPRAVGRSLLADRRSAAPEAPVGHGALFLPAVRASPSRQTLALAIHASWGLCA